MKEGFAYLGLGLGVAVVILALGWSTDKCQSSRSYDKTMSVRTACIEGRLDPDWFLINGFPPV